MIARMLTLLMWAILTATSAAAGTTPEEQRARDIGAQLRCVVCQNQSIEESDAQLAQDMRLAVREQVRDGASDADVIAYMRGNYGDYVLLKPPVQANTYVLWFLPAVLILIGLFWFIARARRPKTTQIINTDLTPNDQALLDDLMRENT